MIDLDGRTGEGGGQLVRIAVALAAITGQPLRITNIRGNRRPRGGLKSQHVAAIEWLAAASNAAVEGVKVGSATITFRPKHTAVLGPQNPITLRAATPAASATLMLQAVLPYLLFARRSADDQGPTHVHLYGGTHVSFAPSFDYLDQVLFPTLESWFGIRVERELINRGWSTGPSRTTDGGVIHLAVHPLTGTLLIPRMPALAKQSSKPMFSVIEAVDATVLAPADLLEPLSDALAREVADSPVLSPDPTSLTVDLNFHTLGDSGHDSRVYVLLVAKTKEGEDGTPALRWGRDYLGSGTILRIGRGGDRGGSKAKGGKKNVAAKKPQKNTANDATSSSASESISRPLSDRIAKSLVRELAEEVARGGCGDTYLQDQVVVFQALAAGRTSFWKKDKGKGGESIGEDIDALEQAVQRFDLDDEQEEGAEKEVEREKEKEDRNHVGDENEEKKDRVKRPFGQGSMHAATARWVTAELLPGVQWFNQGTVCTGVGCGKDTQHAES